MVNLNHLMSKHGVLVAFNIARRVTAADMAKLEKLKKQSKNDEEYFSKVRKLMMMSVKKSFDNKTIPGVIEPSNIVDSNKSKELEAFAQSIYLAIKNKKIKKLEIVFIIQLILTNLNVTNQDFEEFYKKYNLNLDDDEDDEDDF